MDSADKIKGVFRVTIGEISPPRQVFVNPAFEYSITWGGYLVRDANEFHAFENLLKSLGESEFYFVQNIGNWSGEGYAGKLSVDISYEEFTEMMDSIDPYKMGAIIFDFFVFGNNLNWGIYICEWPTINIIGCLPHLSAGFRTVFEINGTGLDEIESFLDKEYSLGSNPEYKATFISNYKL